MPANPPPPTAPATSNAAAIPYSIGARRRPARAYSEQDQPVPQAYGALTNPVGVPGAWSLVGVSSASVPRAADRR
jgi:hypothetical protein